MIKKYIVFLNEKLTDKLKGFDEQKLKQQYFSGKISIDLYYKCCEENEIIPFTSDEIVKQYLNGNIKSMYELINDCEYYNIEMPFEFLKNEFLKGKLKAERYLELCKDHNIELPNIKYIKNLYYNFIIDIDEYLEICEYYYELPRLEEIYNYYKQDLFSFEILIEIKYNYYKIKPTYIQLKEYLENNEINIEEFNKIVKQYDIKKVFY